MLIQDKLNLCYNLSINVSGQINRDLKNGTDYVANPFFCLWNTQGIDHAPQFYFFKK